MLLLVSIWHAPHAEAGWRLVATTFLTTSSTPSTLPAEVVLSVSRNRVKYETRAWVLVVNLTTQRVMLLNQVQHTYWEGPIDVYLADAEKRARLVRQQKAHLLRRLSPEQRLVMEKRSGPFDSGSPTLKITATPTTETTKIAGHSTTTYVVSRNGEPYEETWLAKDIHLGAEVKTAQLQEFFRKLQAARTTPPGTVLAELTQLVVSGYPARTVNLGSQMTKELRQSEQTSIPESEFSAPQDYTLTPLAEVMAMPKPATVPAS